MLPTWGTAIQEGEGECPNRGVEAVGGSFAFFSKLHG